ncbi:MAG: hypothetical protein ACE5KJ_02105, partial [Candidatus Zixiibacteriota bacterium]
NTMGNFISLCKLFQLSFCRRGFDSLFIKALSTDETDVADVVFTSPPLSPLLLEAVSQCSCPIHGAQHKGPMNWATTIYRIWLSTKSGYDTVSWGRGQG